MKKMPAVYLPHGGGPWPFVAKPLFGPAGQWDQMEAYMRGLGAVPPERPRAVLLVSAHWEEDEVTVMAAERPSMLYDYYGFPPEAYEVQWPAPGAPDVAAEVRTLLEKAHIPCRSDTTRGFDHGTFVPLKLAYPEANVPTLQLSLKTGLDPAQHLAIGRALAPLREHGVYIVGSGMSYHNLGRLVGQARGGPAPTADSKAFDDWLAEALLRAGDEREKALIEWSRAPAARACHPREEHLIPLHVVAGAALADRAQLPYRDVVMGAHVLAAHFS